MKLETFVLNFELRREDLKTQKTNEFYSVPQTFHTVSDGGLSTAWRVRCYPKGFKTSEGTKQFNFFISLSSWTPFLFDGDLNRRCAFYIQAKASHEDWSTLPASPVAKILNKPDQWKHCLAGNSRTAAVVMRVDVPDCDLVHCRAVIAMRSQDLSPLPLLHQLILKHKKRAGLNAGAGRMAESLWADRTVKLEDSGKPANRFSDVDILVKGAAVLKANYAALSSQSLYFAQLSSVQDSEPCPKRLRSDLIVQWANFTKEAAQILLHQLYLGFPGEMKWEQLGLDGLRSLLSLLKLVEPPGMRLVRLEVEKLLVDELGRQGISLLVNVLLLLKSHDLPILRNFACVKATESLPDVFLLLREVPRPSRLFRLAFS